MHTGCIACQPLSSPRGGTRSEAALAAVRRPAFPLRRPPSDFPPPFLPWREVWDVRALVCRAVHLVECCAHLADALLRACGALKKPTFVMAPAGWYGVPGLTMSGGAR